MAHVRNPSSASCSTLGDGGPGFAPHFADTLPRVEVGPARREASPAILTGERLDGRALKPAVAQAPARTASRSRALFERENSGSGGPHMLNRAFSGTYPEKR